MNVAIIQKKITLPANAGYVFYFFFFFLQCHYLLIPNESPKKRFIVLIIISETRLTFECKKLGAVLKVVSIYSWTIWHIILVWKDMYNLSILYEIQSAFQVSTICITLVINSAILWKELMGFKENRSNWMFKYSLFKMIILVLLAAIG